MNGRSLEIKRVDRWLSKKVNDPTIRSIWDDTKYLLDVTHGYYEPISKYTMYYDDDDGDIRNNADTYVYMLDQYNNDNYAPIDGEELELLRLLDKIMERYRPLSFFKNDDEDTQKYRKEEEDDKWETVTNNKSKDVGQNKHQEEDDDNSDDTREIDVIIPPNSNRYHANYLFKKMVDYSIKNDQCYDIEDPKMGIYESHILIDPSLKDAFYAFCYNNSKHT